MSVQAHSVGEQPAASGRLRSAWYAVLFLSVFYAIALIDRFIVAFLAQPIAAEMSLSDTQLGLLSGLGFAVLYTLIGLPLAHVIDHRSRTRLLFAGVLCWSVCTVLSAFAPTYGWLLVLRSGVAIGEAVLTPAAISMIGDLFPREKRAMPTAVYISTSTLMMYGGSFILASNALVAAEWLEPVTQMAAWRTTLVIVGLPGVVLALIWLATVREPRRQGQEDAEERAVPLSEAVAYLREHCRFYVPFFTAIVGTGIILYSNVSWIVTILVRSYGMDLAQAGAIYGSIGLFVGGSCSLFWPLVASYFGKRREDSIVLILAVCLAGATLSYGSLLFATTSFGALLASGIATFFISAMPLAMLMVQSVAPAGIKARVTAVFTMAYSLMGAAIGPVLVAVIADRLLEGPFALRTAFSWVCLAMGLVAVVGLLKSRPAYLRAIQGLKS